MSVLKATTSPIYGFTDADAGQVINARLKLVKGGATYYAQSRKYTEDWTDENNQNIAKIQKDPEPVENVKFIRKGNYLTITWDPATPEGFGYATN